jgi:hypothetical protein
MDLGWFEGCFWAIWNGLHTRYNIHSYINTYIVIWYGDVTWGYALRQSHREIRCFKSQEVNNHVLYTFIGKWWKPHQTNRKKHQVPDNNLGHCGGYASGWWWLIGAVQSKTESRASCVNASQVDVITYAGTIHTCWLYKSESLSTKHSTGFLWLIAVKISIQPFTFPGAALDLPQAAQTPPPSPPQPPLARELRRTTPGTLMW